MCQIFENPNLEQPSKYEYLWKFIKKDRIQSFLNGELYFSQLFEYDDYFESITPLHHALLSFNNIIRNHEHFPKIKHTIGLKSLFQRSIFNNEIASVIKQIKRITGNDSTSAAFEILIEAIGNWEKIEKEHNSLQKKFLCNCWFIGDIDESALMWNCYSDKGGIAVKIPFYFFKNSMENYFKSKKEFDPDENIKTVTAGKVIYSKYSYNESWNTEIEKGTPLHFFKHSSYSNENEYRIVIEVSDINNIKKIHYPFQLSTHQFEIILHPSATNDDKQFIKNMYSHPESLNISFSELSFRK